MSLNNNDPTIALNQVAEAALDAAEAVLTTSSSIKEASERQRRDASLDQPVGLTDQMNRFARKAPLRSLAIAFLLGMLATRLR